MCKVWIKIMFTHVGTGTELEQDWIGPVPVRSLKAISLVPVPVPVPVPNFVEPVLSST